MMAAGAMKTFDDDALIVQRSSRRVAVAAIPVALGAALACTGQPSAAGLGVALGWLGAGCVLYVWGRSPGSGEHPVRARADARGLFVDGRLVLESRSIEGGWVQPRSRSAPLVHLCARGAGRDLELVVREAEQGRALLRALGVDPTRVSAHYWTLARPLGEPRAFARAATLLALVLAFGIVAGQTAPAALALVVVALLVLFLGGAVPTHVVVGADGVLLRWLGTTRFVGWSTVAAIEAFDGGVVLALGGGEWLTLRTPAGHERHHPERDAMIERMRSAWRAHTESTHAQSDEATAALLRRAGGGTCEWVRAMRAVPASREGYRRAALPAERLWDVVENPCAGRTPRVGAALALAPLLDAGGRERLRAAAWSCAEPRLRIALTTAATPAAAKASADELAAALDAIESEGEDERPGPGAAGFSGAASDSTPRR
jgi:hypothetical protein